jgi:hypothetical protein
VQLTILILPPIDWSRPHSGSFLPSISDRRRTTYLHEVKSLLQILVAHRSSALKL